MASTPPVQATGRKLYIGGLMENVLKDDLVRELAKYGEIADVWVARSPPGFAFAEYTKTADAEKAVRVLAGATVCGSRVRVEFAHGGRKSGGSRSRGSRQSGRGRSRRYDSPPRRSGRNASPYNGSRYPNYDHAPPMYPPDVPDPAGFSYGMGGYPSAMPFASDNFYRNMQPSRRRSPGRVPMQDFPRGRSPISRRRSRSPLGFPNGRPRGRTPPMFYDARSFGRRPEIRGRGGFGDFGPRPPRDGPYSPPGMDMNGGRDESRGRFDRGDRRAR